MARRHSAAPYTDPAIREMHRLAQMYRTGERGSRRIRVGTENYDPHLLDTVVLAARGALQLAVSSFFTQQLGLARVALAEEACDLIIEHGHSPASIAQILEPLMESATTPVPDLDIGAERASSFWGTTSDGVEHYGAPRRRRTLDIEDYTDECESFAGDLEEEIDRTEGDGVRLTSLERRIVEVDLATGDEVTIRTGRDGLPLYSRGKKAQERKAQERKALKLAKAAEQKPRPLTLRQKLRGRPDELPDS